MAFLLIFYKKYDKINYKKKKRGKRNDYLHCKL